MKITKVIVLFVIFHLSFIIWGASEARAQTVGLSVSPPLAEIMIKPGKSVILPFIVSNSGSATSVKVDLSPITAEDVYGNVRLGPKISGFDPQSFSSWFAFIKPKMKYGGSFSLAEGRQREILLQISPPEDVSQGDYYFSLTFETTPEDKVIAGNSLPQAKIGSNILLTVSSSGNPSKSAKITTFQAPLVLDYLQSLNYYLEIENNGPTYFKPNGRIIIRDLFGRTQVLTLAPQNILASSRRVIACQENDQIIPCSPKNKLPLGFYKAMLVFSLDNGEGLYQKEIITLVVPTALLIIITAISIICLKVIKIVRNNRPR